LTIRHLSQDGNELDQSYATGQQLLDEFRKVHKMGLLPDAPEVAALAQRWKSESASLTPADEQFIQSAERYYKENPDEGIYYGMDGELYAYIKLAVSLL
jgi:hypothetical protein